MTTPAMQNTAFKKNSDGNAKRELKTVETQISGSIRSDDIAYKNCTCVGAVLASMRCDHAQSWARLRNQLLLDGRSALAAAPRPNLVIGLRA